MVYTVLFDVDNGDGELMPQMTAQVSFVTAQSDNALAIPLASLDERADPSVPLTVRVLGRDGQAETRKVRTGVRNRQLVKVIEGLQEGELVITGERKGDRVRRFKL